MIKLTTRQQEILDLVKSHIESTGYPPTRADIAKEFGFRSANAAEEHLKALAKKGAIEIIPGASRGIKIIGGDSKSEGLPIVGKVAAGQPLISSNHIQDYCQIPASFFAPQANYLLEVQGDSMINVGIMDGDLLAVHHCKDASNGQIIVARVDDEVTVKRLKYGKTKQHVELIAENDDYKPIKVNLKEQAFQIEGISVGVIRRN